MASHSEAVADLKRKIIWLLKEEWGPTVAQIEKGEDRFTLERFQRYLEAPPVLLKEALDQLVKERILVTFDDVVGLCYQLAEDQPYVSG